MLAISSDNPNFGPELTLEQIERIVNQTGGWTYYRDWFDKHSEFFLVAMQERAESVTVEDKHFSINYKSYDVAFVAPDRNFVPCGYLSIKWLTSLREEL